MPKIKLNSKDGDDNYLRTLTTLDGQKTNSYLLQTSDPTIKVGTTAEGKQTIYPSGGPRITEGEVLAPINKRIKDITYALGHGYIITFEE